MLCGHRRRAQLAPLLRRRLRAVGLAQQRRRDRVTGRPPPVAAHRSAAAAARQPPGRTRPPRCPVPASATAASTTSPDRVGPRSRPGIRHPHHAVAVDPGGARPRRRGLPRRRRAVSSAYRSRVASSTGCRSCSASRPPTSGFAATRRCRVRSARGVQLSPELLEPGAVELHQHAGRSSRPPGPACPRARRCRRGAQSMPSSPTLRGPLGATPPDSLR